MDEVVHTCYPNIEETHQAGVHTRLGYILRPWLKRPKTAAISQRQNSCLNMPKAVLGSIPQHSHKKAKGREGELSH